MTFYTDCSHDEFKYYSFMEDGWLPLQESATDHELNISYTNQTTSHDAYECVYQIRIGMTEEMNKHLQGVIFLRSGKSGIHNETVCHSSPRKYNINSNLCNGTQEVITPGPTTTSFQQTTMPTYTANNQYLMTSSSHRVIVGNFKMLLLLCLLMYTYITDFSVE